MTFIFRNMTIFWDIPKWLPKWNKGQTNWNEGSNILLNPTHTFMAADPSLEKANHTHMRERERERERERVLVGSDCAIDQFVVFSW